MRPELVGDATASLTYGTDACLCVSDDSARAGRLANETGGDSLSGQEPLLADARGEEPRAGRLAAVTRGRG
jgi:hypothetical protein